MIADSAAAALERLITDDVRFRTAAKGLARSLVWRNGVPPPEMGPSFGAGLTSNLLLQADRSLISALHLVDSRTPERVELGKRGFHRAAEAYESLLRNGDPADPRRALNRILAAASYHLAGYAASAFSLLKMAKEGEQATSDLMLQAIGFLLERDLEGLETLVRSASLAFYWRPEGSAPATTRVEEEASVAQNFAHALSLFVYAMCFNRRDAVDECLRRISIGERFALETGDVWTQLLHAVSCRLLRGLWASSIMNAIPVAAPPGTSAADWSAKRELLGRVLGARRMAELELWPSQIAAVARVFEGDASFAAALPTSAGKTRIAELATFKVLLAGKRVLYITPLRALSAQVERGFRKLFGPLGFSISALYGAQGVTQVDQATFADNDIVVATPEKAGFALRNAPTMFDRVGLVIFDEAHLVGGETRGVAYEALIVALKRRADRDGRRMIALSALLPEMETTTAAFSRWMSDGAFPAPIGSPLVQGQSWRPTRQCFGSITRIGVRSPARFRYDIDVGGEISWVTDFVVQQIRPPVRPKRTPTVFPADRNELALASAEKMVAAHKSVLIYCPVVDSVDSVCRKYLDAVGAGFIQPFPVAEAGRADVERASRIAEESLPHGSDLVRALRAGLAVHHGQLPRAYLREIDRLISLSIVRVVVASPTVNAGLNISATCVLFNGVSRGEMERFQRWNGEYGRRLKVLDGAESMNVAGRAGRAFVDTQGEVLGICFTSDQKKHWDRLRLGMAQRSFTSGLAAVLDRLIVTLEGSNNSARHVRDLIANQADAIWAQPPIDPDDISKWSKAVQSLDQALLAFVDDLEVDVAQLAARLDQALTGSFFRAAIQGMQREASYLFLVHSRSRILWRSSTAEQRKGWYFAGVGLHDGLLLDQKAPTVAPLILEVEMLLLFGETDGVVERLITIAGELFEIPSFRPKNGPPVGWERIMRRWLGGTPLQLIFAGEDDAEPDDDAYRAAGHFIEDGIVYRLTWGMEAVRVRRPDLLAQEPLSPDRGLQCAAFLECGTLDRTVAMLLQIGLPSRRVAQEVVEHEELDVARPSTLRAWLRQARDEPPARWAYLDEAIRRVWITFVAQNGAGEFDQWHATAARLPLNRYPRTAAARVEGVLRRVDTTDGFIGEFQAADGTPLGRTEWPHRSLVPSFALATLNLDDTIETLYLGPRA